MNKFDLPLIAWLVFVCAALLEVGGDALIRMGLRTSFWICLILGALSLIIYGFVVNLVRWDFSKLMGVYVAVFAVISFLVSFLWMKEPINGMTVLGLLIIVVGGLVVQFS